MAWCGSAVAVGLAGPWAVGCLVLVAQATVLLSGVSVALGVPLAAAAAILAAVCSAVGRQDERRRGDLASFLCSWAQLLGQGAALAACARRLSATMEYMSAAVCSPVGREDVRRRGDLASFLCSWAQLLGHGAALAACARTLSATMDYMSAGKYGGWVAHQVGLPARSSSPDLLAVAVTLVTSLLVTLGLEQSAGLRLVLNLAVGCGLVFFVSVGSLHADLDNWAHHHLLTVSGSEVLAGAAMCSYGFLGLSTTSARTRAEGRRAQLVTVTITALVTVMSYCTVAIVLVIMVHVSALEGSAVPLVKVFEVRDVDWARLVMAVCSILCLGLALLEVGAPMHSLVVCLAGEEWQILPRALSKESWRLGTPALAIMSSGCVVGILAGVCPLDPLLRAMCTGPLLQQALSAAHSIHAAYRPAQGSKPVRYRRLGNASCEGDETDDEDAEVEAESRLRKRQQVTVGCLKAGLGFLPSVVRHHVPAEALRFCPGPAYRHSIASHDSDNTLLTSMSCDDVLTESASIDSFVDHASLLWTSVNSDVDPSPKLTDNPLAKTVANGFVKLQQLTFSSDKPHIPTNISNINYIPFNKSGLNGVERDILVMCKQEKEFMIKNNENQDYNFENAPPHDLSTRSENDSKSTDVNHVYGNLGCSREEASDGEDSTSSSSMTDENSHSSTTDIDAAVAEYKERLKVVALRTELQPTQTSSRVVAVALCGVLFCATLLGVDSLSGGEAGTWCAGMGAVGLLLLLAVIAWQPRAPSKGQCPLVPWVPAVGLVLNVVLCCQLLLSVWHFVLGYMLAGCVLYWWRRGSKSILQWVGCRRRRRLSCKEQIRLQVPPRQSTVPRLIPSHQHLPGDRARRLTRVDTILIAR